MKFIVAADTQIGLYSHFSNIKDKSERCAQYIIGFRKELLQLTYASGYQHPSEFTGQDIEISTGVNKFIPLDDVLEYKK